MDIDFDDGFDDDEISEDEKREIAIEKAFLEDFLDAAKHEKKDYIIRWVMDAEAEDEGVDDAEALEHTVSAIDLLLEAVEENTEQAGESAKKAGASLPYLLAMYARLKSYIADELEEFPL